MAMVEALIYYPRHTPTIFIHIKAGLIYTQELKYMPGSAAEGMKYTPGPVYTPGAKATKFSKR